MNSDNLNRGLSQGQCIGGFAVIDFETTGLHVDSGHRVVQAAVVRISLTGEIEGDWSSLVNPKARMGAEEVHGISHEEVQNAPTFEEIWSQLTRELEGRCVVGQNVRFDLGFLFSEISRFKQASKLASMTFVDNRELAHLIAPGSNRRQRTIAAALGIDYFQMPGRGPHDALTDAHVAAKIFQYHLKNWPLQVFSKLTLFEPA